MIRSCESLRSRSQSNIGHPLIVENITGAAGLIGAERLAHAPADGYTIGVMSDSMLAVVPHLQPRINYDPLEGFEPVSMLASITSVLVVNPQLSITNLGEFVTFAKTRPGMVDYASGGIGSQQHVAMAALQRRYRHLLEPRPVSRRVAGRNGSRERARASDVCRAVDRTTSYQGWSTQGYRCRK